MRCIVSIVHGYELHSQRCSALCWLSSALYVVQCCTGSAESCALDSQRCSALYWLSSVLYAIRYALHSQRCTGSTQRCTLCAMRCIVSVVLAQFSVVRCALQTQRCSAINRLSSALCFHLSSGRENGLSRCSWDQDKKQVSVLCAAVGVTERTSGSGDRQGINTWGTSPRLPSLTILTLCLQQNFFVSNNNKK